MVISAHFELQTSEWLILLATSKVAASIFGNCEVEVMLEAAGHVSCGVVVRCDWCDVVGQQW